MLSKFQRRPVDSVDAVRRACNVVVDGATFEERGGRFEWVSNAVELEVRHYSAVFLRRLLAWTPHVTSLVLRDVDAAPCEDQRCSDASAAPQDTDRLTRCRLQSLTVHQRPFEASSTDTEKKHSEDEDNERQAIEDAAVAAASAMLDCCEFRELAALSLSGTTFACTRAFLRAVPMESTSLGNIVVPSRASDLEAVLHRCTLQEGVLHHEENVKAAAVNGAFVLAWRSRPSALLAAWTTLAESQQRRTQVGASTERALPRRAPPRIRLRNPPPALSPEMAALPVIPVVVLGGTTSGKTALLQQLRKKEHPLVTRFTIGANIQMFSFPNIATLRLFEVADDSRRMLRMYLKHGFAAAIVVADVNDATSLESAVEYKEQFLQHCEPSLLRDSSHIPTFLVLNKEDLAKETSVRESEYRAFRDRYRFDDMWLVSAKDHQRVYNMFQTIAWRLVTLCEPGDPPTRFSQRIRPPPEKQGFFSWFRKN